jgi:hypothetical protein
MDLSGKIITIPEMQEALRGYRCDEKISDELLRKFCAVLEKQIIKTRKQTIEEFQEELFVFVEKFKEKK